MGLTVLLGLGTIWPPLTLVVSILAPFNIGTYELNGTQVTGPDFIRGGGLLAFWLVAAFLGALAYAIWSSRRWLRPVAMTAAVAISGWTLVVGWREGGSAWASALLSAMLLASTVYWYFYRKSTVQSYFAATEQHSGVSTVA